jgi:hypothetical protein
MLTESSSITIPLTITDRQLSMAQAERETNPDNQSQCYWQALARRAVQTYLRWMEVDVDGDRSTVDLYLSGLGKRLTCLPIRPGDRDCAIPLGAQPDRLGYVGVRLDAKGYEAELIGFLATATTARVPLSQFADLETLLIALEPQSVKLGQWLQRQFESHWQSVEAFIQSAATPEPNVACLPTLVGTVPMLSSESEATVTQLLEQLQQVSLRDEEKRWQLVEQLWTLAPEHPAIGVRRISDLGLYLGGASVALMVAILPKPDQSVAVLLRVYPMRQVHLPKNLTLEGLYESGQSFLESTAREIDNYIQLKFSATIGERFGVRIKFGEAEYLEHFMI